MMKHNENLMVKKHPYYEKSMSTNFLGSVHAKYFIAFSRAIGNWWGNSSIFHMMKYTTGWKTNGKKHPYYRKNTGNRFPGFPHLMGFYCIFPCCGKLMKNPFISHVMKIYHRIGTRWEKSTQSWEKYEYEFGRFSPYDGFCCIFPCYEKLIENFMHFPYDEIR